MTLVTPALRRVVRDLFQSKPVSSYETPPHKVGDEMAVAERIGRVEALLIEQGQALEQLRDFKPKRRLRYTPLDGFMELARPVLEHDRTLLGLDRLYVLWQSVRNVATLGLAAAEVGSYRGGSAYFIASAFQRLAGREVDMHIFDTFEGHPANKITTHDPFHTEGMFADTNHADVVRYLSPFERLHVHKGEFSATLNELPQMAFSFAHIDTDLYEPTLDCLAYFGERLAVGGVIVIDDYASKKCPGVRQAAHEYTASHPRFQVWDVQTEQLVLIKGSG